MSNILYRTQTMLAAIKQMLPRNTFLRDRYFPTNDASDIFPTEDVLVEYKDGNKKMAPCVMPRKKGITIARDGYRTTRYTPPYIAPQRSLTIDELNRKGFGENLYSNITPEQRQAQILGQDLMDFDDMISAREEYIAAKALLDNGYVLRHYADKYGTGVYEEFEMRFYDGNNNPAKYTPAEAWNDQDGDIFGDLKVMISQLTSRGLAATDLIMAPDVAETILDNAKIQKLLDNRNMAMGNINPTTLPSGAASLGTINVYGRKIELFTYDETYEDEETGEVVPYIPVGNIVLTAPNCGRGLYGAVNQMEQADKQFHTYVAKRVPKYLADAESDVKTLKVTSRPLFIPRNANPWISAEVQ